MCLGDQPKIVHCLKYKAKLAELCVLAIYIQQREFRNVNHIDTQWGEKPRNAVKEATGLADSWLGPSLGQDLSECMPVRPRPGSLGSPGISRQSCQNCSVIKMFTLNNETLST